jgi:hypothetical protein
VASLFKLVGTLCFPLVRPSLSQRPQHIGNPLIDKGASPPREGHQLISVLAVHICAVNREQNDNH